MAATAASEISEGPVLSLITKRLRALRKKLNRISQMEKAISQGKPLNREQEISLEKLNRSKPSVLILIDELEKLGQPLAAAVSEEISLAVQRHQVSASTQSISVENSSPRENRANEKSTVQKDESGNGVVEDLLNLLYFGSLFDVKSQTDFNSTMLTRTHERGCCLTYDYVSDDATDLLGERDLDLISMMGGLLISRPLSSSWSHKNALQQCIEHAKLWLAKADQPFEPNSSITYAALRERLNKIMASDYFTTIPEFKAPVDVAAVAAAGNYVNLQVPVPIQGEGSTANYPQKDQAGEDFPGHDDSDGPSSPVEELHKDEVERENPSDLPIQQDENEQEMEAENIQRDFESNDQQYIPRRSLHYSGQRSGRGGVGGRRGYSSGSRGGRGGGRGGGPFQNGHNQYYDQSGNYYQRNYYSKRERGGGGSRGGGNGGGYSYNNNGGFQGGHASSPNVSVAS